MIFNLYKYSQIDNFMRQQGYSDESINLVLSQDKEVKKLLGKELQKTKVNENDLPALIQKVKEFYSAATPAPTIDPITNAFANSSITQEEFWPQIPKTNLDFVKKIIANGSFSPDSIQELLAILSSFNLLIERAVPIQKDINQYKTLSEVKKVVERFAVSENAKSYLRVDPYSLPGVVAKKSGPYTIFEVSDPESLALMGLSTKWCTRKDYNDEGGLAEEYLINRKYGKIMIVTKGGEHVLQFTPDFSEAKDIRDKQIDKPIEGLNLDDYIKDYLAKNKSSSEGMETISILASDELKSDKKFSLAIVKHNCLSYSFLPQNVKFEREILLEALQCWEIAISVYADLPPELKENEEYYELAFNQNPLAYFEAPKNIQLNPDFAFLALENAEVSFSEFPEELRGDRTFMEKAIEFNGGRLSYATPELLRDEKFIKKVVVQDICNLRFLPDDYRKDRAFVKKILTDAFGKQHRPPDCYWKSVLGIFLEDIEVLRLAAPIFIDEMQSMPLSIFDDGGRTANRVWIACGKYQSSSSYDRELDDLLENTVLFLQENTEIFQDKQKLKQLFISNPFTFCTVKKVLPFAIEKDDEMYLKILEYNPKAAACMELDKDEQLLIRACEVNFGVIRYINPKIFLDFDLSLQVVKSNADCFTEIVSIQAVYLSHDKTQETLDKIREFYLKSIIAHPKLIYYWLDGTFPTDIPLIAEAIKMDPQIYKGLTWFYRENPELKRAYDSATEKTQANSWYNRAKFTAQF